MKTFAILIVLCSGAAFGQTADVPAKNETLKVREPLKPMLDKGSSTTQAPVKLRSSHTVDVIAPGEKVDTIFGRMRTQGPPTGPRGDAMKGGNGPVRGPDKQNVRGPDAQGGRGGPNGNGHGKMGEGGRGPGPGDGRTGDNPPPPPPDHR